MNDENKKTDASEELKQAIRAQQSENLPDLWPQIEAKLAEQKKADLKKAAAKKKTMAFRNGLKGISAAAAVLLVLIVSAGLLRSALFSKDYTTASSGPSYDSGPASDINEDSGSIASNSISEDRKTASLPDADDASDAGSENASADSSADDLIIDEDYDMDSTNLDPKSSYLFRYSYWTDFHDRTDYDTILGIAETHLGSENVTTASRAYDDELCSSCKDVIEMYHFTEASDYSSDAFGLTVKTSDYPSTEAILEELSAHPADAYFILTVENEDDTFMVYGYCSATGAENDEEAAISEFATALTELLQEE